MPVLDVVADAAVMDDVIELDDAVIRSAQDGLRAVIGELGREGCQEVVATGARSKGAGDGR